MRKWKRLLFFGKAEVKKPEKEEIAKMIQQATDAMGGIVQINDLKHSGHLQIKEVSGQSEDVSN